MIELDEEVAQRPDASQPEQRPPGPMWAKECLRCDLEHPHTPDASLRDGRASTSQPHARPTRSQRRWRPWAFPLPRSTSSISSRVVCWEGHIHLIPEHLIRRFTDHAREHLVANALPSPDDAI